MWLARCTAVLSAAALLVTTPVLGHASAATPHPVAGSDHTVDLTGAGTLSVAASDTSSPAGTTLRQVAVGGGSMVGVTLPAATDASEVQVRVQDGDGSWGRWTSLTVDGGPDQGSNEARRAKAASDPLWIGPGDPDRQVQVELPRADVARAALSVVDPGTSAADAAVTASGPAARASAATRGAPVIHPRRDWGADETLRTCAPSYAPTTEAAVLHHTADTNDYTADQVPMILRSIYRYHTQTQGWCDIGYNVLVDRFGGIWEGRAGGLDRAVVGAHAGGFNYETFGVSMMGDFMTVAPTGAQLESVAQVMAWKLGDDYVDPHGHVTLTSAGGGTDKYPVGAAVTLPTIFGHRDVGNTACPGDVGYTELPWIRDRVAQLIGAPSGVLYDAWQARGGTRGFLGDPATTVGATATAGTYQHFGGGSLYWTAATGAHSIQGAIRGTWAGIGWETSPLGYPVTDETGTPDGLGRYNHFQGGSVYWTPATGAHVVRGAIRATWAGAGWETSPLGYPVTDELGTPDGVGRYNHFQGGSIYWTPTTGAHTVSGAIRSTWAALGWELSTIGYPTSDAQPSATDPTATVQTFQHGTITATATGSTTVIRR